MPTTTFFNLPEEKKERIVAAAVREFAQYPFSQASINRIIKDAAIPRGSFYQYFEGKEDLYRFIIHRISEEKITIYSHYESAPDADFFDNMLAAIPTIYAWAEQQPEYNRIGLFLAQDDTDFIRQLYHKMDLPRTFLADALRQDQERGLIRKDVDLDIVVELFFALGTSWLKEYYIKGTAESTIEKVKRFFDILRNGLTVSKEGKHHDENDSAS